MFAPLSPTSSRRLTKIHKNAESKPESIHTDPNGHSQPHQISSSKYTPPANESSFDTDPHASYDCHHRSGDKRRRRSRRNSDPSSDRPNQPSKHRRRQRHASRSPSPASNGDEVEILPDRFDENGRPLDRYGNRFGRSGGERGLGVGGGQSEMVERIVRDVGDVVEGKKSWKDLLRGVLEEGGSGSGSGSDGGRRKRRG